MEYGAVGGTFFAALHQPGETYQQSEALINISSGSHRIKNQWCRYRRKKHGGAAGDAAVSVELRSYPSCKIYGKHTADEYPGAQPQCSGADLRQQLQYQSIQRMIIGQRQISKYLQRSQLREVYQSPQFIILQLCTHRQNSQRSGKNQYSGSNISKKLR